MDPEELEPVVLPIDGILDLHAFSPRDAVSVVDEYMEACLEKGIHEVRIIHGKGKGVLRRTVQSFLQKDPRVLHFSVDDGFSGWGATVAFLKPRETSAPSPVQP